MGVPLHLNGLLGYGEVLDRITSLESKLAELADRFARLEERMLVVEEEPRGVGGSWLSMPAGSGPSVRGS